MHDTSWYENHLCLPCHMLFRDQQTSLPAKLTKQRMTKQGQNRIEVFIILILLADLSLVAGMGETV